MSDLEAALLFYIRSVGLPEPVPEYRFDQVRKYRFDFAWPELKVACEVEGGTFQGGRHTRGLGYHNDCKKYNLATEQGWRVFRFDALLVNSGDAIALLERVVK